MYNRIDIYNILQASVDPIALTPEAETIFYPSLDGIGPKYKIICLSEVSTK